MKKIGCVQHDCGECESRKELINSLIEDLDNLGFDDPDESVDGGDCVDYLAALYEDLQRMK